MATGETVVTGMYPGLEPGLFFVSAFNIAHEVIIDPDVTGRASILLSCLPDSERRFSTAARRVRVCFICFSEAACLSACIRLMRPAGSFLAHSAFMRTAASMT